MEKQKYQVYEIVDDSYAATALKMKEFWQSKNDDVEVIDSHLFYDKFTGQVYYIVVTRTMKNYIELPEGANEITIKKRLSLWTRVKNIWR